MRSSALFFGLYNNIVLDFFVEIKFKIKCLAVERDFIDQSSRFECNSVRTREVEDIHDDKNDVKLRKGRIWKETPALSSHQLDGNDNNSYIHNWSNRIFLLLLCISNYFHFSMFSFINIKEVMIGGFLFNFSYYISDWNWSNTFF